MIALNGDRGALHGEVRDGVGICAVAHQVPEHDDTRAGCYRAGIGEAGFKGFKIAVDVGHQGNAHADLP